MTWADFNSLSLIFQCLVHLLILFSVHWAFSTATDYESSTAITAVSSAKVPMNVSSDVGMSAVYNKHRRGPRMIPCGTPACMG